MSSAKKCDVCEKSHEPSISVEEILVEMYFDIDKKRRDTEYMNEWKDGYNSCLNDILQYIQDKINN